MPVITTSKITPEENLGDFSTEHAALNQTNTPLNNIIDINDTTTISNLMPPILNRPLSLGEMHIILAKLIYDLSSLQTRIDDAGL